MLKRSLLVAVLVTPSVFAQGGPVVFAMGDLPGGPTASRAFGWGWVSALAMVGESSDAAGTWAVVWTKPHGLRRLGTLSPTDQFSRATACTGGAEPPVIIGHSGFAPSPSECRAFRWSPATGMEPIPGPPGGAADLAFGVSSEGGVIVGQATVAGAPRASRWSAGAGTLTLIGLVPTGQSENSCASGVSGNGQVVVGYAQDAVFVTHAVRWTSPEFATSLGHLNTTGFRDSRAHGCSIDGSVVVGESTSPNGSQEAFRWTAQSGMVGLGDLPGGEFRSVALGTSGGWVTGWSDTADGPRAFLWSQSTGMKQVDLTGWPGAAGWTFSRAISGSEEGMVGTGLNSIGMEEGWLSASRGCYADCNGDRVLNLSDFGCFQTQYTLAPYADCNRDGRLNLSDFGCFQTHFVLGCP